MPRVKASLLVMLTTLLTVAVMLMLPYTPKQVVRTMVAQKGEWIQSMMLSGVVSHGKEQICISPRNGRISRVCVEPGQQVSKGELLFLLDTSQEERMLHAMYQAQNEQQKWLADTAASALAAQQNMQWKEKEQQLLYAIESAQIRAEMDGVIGDVYMEEGSYVETAGWLGSVHDGQLCIIASGEKSLMERTEQGALAVLSQEEKPLGVAKVSRIHAPLAQAGGMQQMTLLPLKQEQLAQCAIGETVTVELLMETLSDHVLIPLSAVDADGRVWYAENGYAHAQKLDVSKRNGETVAASSEWEGRSMILSPENLYEGCPVKEAKK